MTRRFAVMGGFSSLSRQAKGLLITSAGVVVLSVQGIPIRLVDVDAWTLMFVRGVLSAPGLFAFFLIVERTRWKEELRAGMGLAGVTAALLFALDNVMFIYSITHTSVANTLLMISLSPLFAGLLTRIALRQQVPRRTWLAIAGAAVATLVIMYGSLVAGDFLGTLAGLVAAIAIGGTLVVLRSKPSLNMVPAVALGAGLAGLVGLPAANPASAGLRDWVLLVILGLVIGPLAFGLIATGPRFIPAAEVALLLLLQTVLGAYWVWIAVGEIPGTATVAGGLMLLVVLTLHSVATLKSLEGDQPA
ncbi:MAG: DMT family transporter [bacterium]|nr:DMT family transporter [bacterium]MDE0288196.1 DMT family transporter [bacterium]MDE0438150.1 DMT family transporter [bacterium]